MIFSEMLNLMRSFRASFSCKRRRSASVPVTARRNRLTSSLTFALWMFLAKQHRCLLFTHRTSLTSDTEYLHQTSTLQCAEIGTCGVPRRLENFVRQFGREIRRLVVLVVNAVLVAVTRVYQKQRERRRERYLRKVPLRRCSAAVIDA